MSELHTLLAIPYREDVRPAIYTDGSPCYLAEIPDLPGCVAYGNTIEEAMMSLNRARVAYITHHHEKNLDVPLPSARASHRWRTEEATEDAVTFQVGPAFA